MKIRSVAVVTQDTYTISEPTYTAEYSAVLYDKDKDICYVANDKTTSITAISYNTKKAILQEDNYRQIDHHILRHTKKYESMTWTDQHHKHALVSTSFSHDKKKNKKILKWDPRTEIHESIKVFYTGDLDQLILYALKIRYPERFRDATSIKIEAISHADDHIYFGIREVHIEDQIYYTVIIYRCCCKDTLDETSLQFVVEYRQEALAAVTGFEREHDFGISELCYDNINQVMFMTTTMEYEDDSRCRFASALWMFALHDLQLRHVTNIEHHKTEGIAIIDSKEYRVRLLLVNDDDTVIRSPCRENQSQFVYFVLDVWLTK